MRQAVAVFSVLAVFLAVFAASRAAHAGNPLVLFPARPERLRAVRYAQESGDACRAELVLRGVPFADGPKVPTI